MSTPTSGPVVPVMPALLPRRAFLAQAALGAASLGLSPAGMRTCAAALFAHDHYDDNRRSALALADALVDISTPNACFFPSQASFILMKPGAEITEADYANAETLTSVRPRYLTLRGERYLRWTLGDERAEKAIRAFVAALTAPRNV